MNSYPFADKKIDWKRPPIDRAVLKQCTEGSDLQGLWHCLGVLGMLTASGSLAYYLYATRHWVWMAIALYVHGALFAFNPQTHEFSHGTVFQSKWLNSLFKRVFGVVHWTSNSALYKMSHMLHHRYTVHHGADGEVVLPMPRTMEQLLSAALRVVDINGLIAAIYDQIHFLVVPFLRSTRRSPWMRYVYAKSRDSEKRDAYWTQFYQFMFHVLFSAVAIGTGHWFLVVVVTLPQFFGGTWYHSMVHDTMHSGRQADVDDFRACCRTVWLDPFTSFLYWHMEWHTEHHVSAGVPCYNLRKYHNLSREYWERPMSLLAAWREMEEAAKRDLAVAESA